MKALQILAQSVRQVFGNMGGALRVSAVPYLLQAGLLLAIGDMGLTNQAAASAAIKAGTFPWGIAALSAIVSLVIGFWVAIAWHRYVLIGERPGLVPAFKAGQMAAYFVHLLVMLVFSMLTILGLAIVAAILSPIINGIPVVTEAFGGIFKVVCIVGFTVIAVSLTMTVFYRLSPMLPGSALGSPMTLAETWESMTGAAGTIFVVALIGQFAIPALGLGVAALLADQPMVTAAWNLVWPWVYLMLGISILTTLYGHYVEKRPIV